MEVKTQIIKEIPYIYVPEVFVPTVYKPQNVTPPILNELSINTPGCSYWHRDIENTGNTQLLIDDPNGVFTICDTVFPNFNSIDYTPQNLVITEEVPNNTNQPNIPEIEPPKIPNNKKDEDVILPPCPSNTDLRVGDFRNDKKLERVISHTRGKNGVECITNYEKVEWKEQYIPSAPQFAGVFSLALVGSSAPLILNAIKPLVKKVITALQKKQKKVK